MLDPRLGFGAIALGLLSLPACSSDPSNAPSQPLPETTTTSTTATSSTGTGGSGGGATTGTGGTGGAGGDTSSAGGGGAGATSTTTGAGGSGTGGGGGGTSTCRWTAPVLVTQGQPDRILLQGMIVTPDQAFDGEVLIVGDLIACVGVSCANDPAAANASVVQTNGVVMPGLIDTHNHILFNVFDETDWSPTQTYTNHDQWPNDLHYKALVDAKQYLNGEFGSALDLGCEMNKHGELRGLIAGTTSIAGSANPANKKCYGSLSRTIDQTSNDLPADAVQSATIFPTTASADGVCTNFGTGKTDAYLIHIGEGVDQTSLNEFAKLGTVTTTDNCLYAAKTTIVHGTALGDPELTTMAASSMSLTWSPRSNVFLYGAGTDLTQTTDIPLARAKGLNISLAPDWSIGGSQNMLDEMRFASAVDDGVWGDVLTSKEILQMSTTHPAKALGLDTVLGSLEVGKKADVVVIAGGALDPYDAILAATPADVQLVLVGGVALYGDEHLQPLGPAAPGCEAITICCGSKFLCVAEASSADKLGQTLGEIEGALTQALGDYDALDLTQWDFSPITPLVTCGP